MAKSSETIRLEEVKILLEQLQRIRSEPASPDPQDEPQVDPHPTSGRPPAGPSNLRKPSIRPIHMAGAAVLLLGVAMAGAAFLFDEPSPNSREPSAAALRDTGSLEPAEPAPETGAVLPLLPQAQQLMLSGDILGARAILVKAADSGPPDVALALARSYDPNFLRSVTNPNAVPDIEQATLWYRRWHHAAVESGLVTDTHRLERILRSMR